MAFREGFSGGRRIEGEGWRWRRARQQPLGAQHHSRRTSLEEKDKGKEKDMGRGEATGGHGLSVQRATTYTGCNTQTQSLWKESNPRNACLSFGSSHLRRPKQQNRHKVTQSKHQGDLDEVCEGEGAPCSTHPTLSPSHPAFLDPQGLPPGLQEKAFLPVALG